jgi:hypothetical protein
MFSATILPHVLGTENARRSEIAHAMQIIIMRHVVLFATLPRRAPVTEFVVRMVLVSVMSIIMGPTVPLIAILLVLALGMVRAQQRQAHVFVTLGILMLRIVPYTAIT